jgi:hypothetical protein
VFPPFLVPSRFTRLVTREETTALLLAIGRKEASIPKVWRDQVLDSDRHGRRPWCTPLWPTRVHYYRKRGQRVRAEARESTSPRTRAWAGRWAACTPEPCWAGPGDCSRICSFRGGQSVVQLRDCYDRRGSVPFHTGSTDCSWTDVAADSAQSGRNLDGWPRLQRYIMTSSSHSHSQDLGWLLCESPKLMSSLGVFSTYASIQRNPFSDEAIVDGSKGIVFRVKPISHSDVDHIILYLIFTNWRLSRSYHLNPCVKQIRSVRYYS